MLKYILMFMLVCISANAADTVQVNGKTYYSEQNTSSTAQAVSEYAKMGADFGSAFAATAKELGVAVNDFSNTGVGKLATWLIIYKLIGRDIIHIFLGMLWFISTGAIWFYAMRRICIIQSITKSFDDKNKTVKTVKYREEISTDAGLTIVFFAIIIMFIGFIIIFTG